MMEPTAVQKFRVLLLGGTSESRQLADRLATNPAIHATLSLAGRTANPAPSAIPIRVGGFGGIAGLRAYLTKERIAAVIDATHPFAAEISNNAVAACEQASVPLIAFERPPWEPVLGDDWHDADTIESAIAALPRDPLRVFSALGRQSISALVAAPQHHYLVRVVESMEPPPNLPQVTIINGRGPFKTEQDQALFANHRIQLILAKNAGGDATYAKIEAARNLGIKVVLVRRPPIAPRPTVATVDAAMNWIVAHQSSR